MLLASVWASTLPTWLLVIAALGVGYRLTKGGGGTAISELSKANEVLTKSLSARDRAIAQLQARVNTLEEKTDVSQVLEPFVAWATSHEESDELRHDQTVKAFTAVTDQLKIFDERADERAKVLAEVTASTSRAAIVALEHIASKLELLPPPPSRKPRARAA